MNKSQDQRIDPSRLLSRAQAVISDDLKNQSPLTSPSSNVRLQVGVDLGGGTTGIAIIENGQVMYTADEATGGTHFSLVIACALDISFDKAETLKIDPAQQNRLFPIVCPVMEKVGSIIAKHIKGYAVQGINLVGGMALFPGIVTVIEEVTSLPTRAISHPLFVTPLRIAMHDQGDSQ